MRWHFSWCSSPQIRALKERQPEEGWTSTWEASLKLHGRKYKALLVSHFWYKIHYTCTGAPPAWDHCKVIIAKNSSKPCQVAVLRSLSKAFGEIAYTLSHAPIPAVLQPATKSLIFALLLRHGQQQYPSWPTHCEGVLAGEQASFYVHYNPHFSWNRHKKGRSWNSRGYLQISMESKTSRIEVSAKV